MRVTTMEENTEIMKTNVSNVIRKYFSINVLNIPVHFQLRCINPIETAAEEERKAKEHNKEVFVRYGLPVRVGNWYEEASRFDVQYYVAQ